MALALALGSAGCSDQSADPLVIDDGPGSVAWSSVAVGQASSCAINDSAAPYCWGYAIVPFCPGDCPTPTRPSGAALLASVDPAGQYACGVSADSTAYCWGRVFVGSLGDGSTDSSAVPVRVAIPGPVLTVTTGYLHACALTTAGVAYCWGGYGSPVGLPGSEKTATPLAIATSLRFTSINAGTSQTCAITASHEGYCWGGSGGSLGAGSRDTTCGPLQSCLSSPVPIPIDGSLPWASLTAGNGFTCGVTVDGVGYCWGGLRSPGDPTPPFGVLGNGQLVGSKSPQPVSGGLRFRQIAAGVRHACGVTVDGAAYCWGNNTSGELGAGITGSPQATPQRVVGSLRLSSLGVGEHSCGLSVNRNVFCWGRDLGGSLGSTATILFGVRPTPTRILSPDR